MTQETGERSFEQHSPPLPADHPYATIWEDLRAAVGYAGEAIEGLMERGVLLESLGAKSDQIVEASANYRERVDPPSRLTRIVRSTTSTLRYWTTTTWQWCHATILCRMMRGEFDKESPLNREPRVVNLRRQEV